MSAITKYKSAVRHYLITKHNWLNGTAKRYVAENERYILSFRDQGISAFNASHIIDKERKG